MSRNMSGQVGIELAVLMLRLSLTFARSLVRHGQDWNPVVLRAKHTTTSQASSKGAVNAAMRSGTCRVRSHVLPRRSRRLAFPSSPSLRLAGSGVETYQKQNAGANAKGPDNRRMYKLEHDSESFAHETVSSSLKKQIQSARLAKKMTQADLAKAINEKPQVINEYENGKAIPNPQVLSKMSRVLGVKLKKSG